MACDTDRQLLRHYLASIAYHTQKALRGAPPGYWTFSPGNRVRTPEVILRHMTSVLGYARTFFLGGFYRPEPLPTIQDEIDRFHEVLEDVARLLDSDSSLQSISELQLLQGPFSDIMTHIGQLSLLRRLFGSPVPPENFIYADISATRLGEDQPAARRPDEDWPEGPAESADVAGWQTENSTPGRLGVDTTSNTIVWQQFGASIDMLENAMRACPEDLWGDRSQVPEFWYVVFHTLFYLDLYLSESDIGFSPPAPFTLDEMDERGLLPDRVYTKEELQKYLEHGREKCRATIAAMTAEKGSQRCGFDWLDISVAEVLLYNMRHVQHHVGQLNLILRQKVDSAPRWVRKTNTKLDAENSGGTN